MARWSLNFDGFNASARLHCGSTACGFDSDLKTGYIRAYVLYFDVWMRMANRRFRRIASPTLNSTLNKKLSGNGVNSYNGGGVVSGSLPIFVPRGMANVIVGTIFFSFCDCCLLSYKPLPDYQLSFLIRCSCLHFKQEMIAKA